MQSPWFQQAWMWSLECLTGKGLFFLEKSWTLPYAFHVFQVYKEALDLIDRDVSTSECEVEEGTKYSGNNLYPLAAETQDECASACLREPECHFWTHNPKVGRILCYVITPTTK